MKMSSSEIKPVLPKSGQLMIEDTEEFVLCKPRLIPLKSYTLEKLDKMQQDVQKLMNEDKKSNRN